MKRNNRLQTRMNQFGYEHRTISGHLAKMKKSADELSKMLDNMTPKPSKEKEKETEKSQK